MNFFKTLLIATTFLASFYSYGQGCATHSPSAKAYAFTRDVVSQINVQALRNAGTTCVPLQAHIVTLDDGSGGITYEQLNIGLTFLNEKFYDSGIEFYYSGIPDLAANSDLYEFDGQAPDSDTEAALKALFTTATDAVNIYFVSEITTASGFQAAGYAYFPSNSANSNTVVMANQFTYDEPQGTFAHEFGHYFNLYHTHQGTEFGNTSANAENVPRTGANANCSTKGDLLCDTEADPRFDSNTFDFGACTDNSGRTDVNGVAYNFPVDNIMSYYPGQCSERFTPNQYTRMAQGLTVRLGHSAYSLNAPPMAVAAPSALAAALNGSAVDLTWVDNASNEMGYVLERSTTSATSGFRSLPYAATGPNATTFSDNSLTSNTTYWYRLKASNGDCNTYSNVATFTTGLFYCSPSYFQTCDGGPNLIIDGVALSGETQDINTFGSGCNTGGFGDYSDDPAQLADVIAGNSYNFSVTASSGGGGYFPAYCQVFVDFNANGSFDDPGETIISGFGTMQPTYSGSITVPANAMNGMVRMRVRATDQSNPCAGGSIGACNDCAFGETEDYSLMVSGGASAGLLLDINVMLEGPFNGTNMDDLLRTSSLLPLTEPYTSIFGHVGDGGSETVNASVFNVVGDDAIVDWVYVELRDKNNSSTVLNTRSALLQRDGDIVDLDGTSSLTFTGSPDSYFVAIRHRNHNGVMSASAIALSGTAVSLNFSDGSLNTFGTDALKLDGGVRLMWMGNTNADSEIKYLGQDNDRDPLLVSIGGSVPTNTLIGYLVEDSNMDGTVKYVGAGNDRDRILQNIGGSIPTAVRVEQLP